MKNMTDVCSVIRHERQARVDRAEQFARVVAQEVSDAVIATAPPFTVQRVAMINPKLDGLGVTAGVTVRLAGDGWFTPRVHIEVYVGYSSGLRVALVEPSRRGNTFRGIPHEGLGVEVTLEEVAPLVANLIARLTIPMKVG